MLFKKENIFLNLEANNKDEVFIFIANKVKEMGFTSNSDKIYQDLWKRENEVSTGFEKGFAIPHAQTNAIEKPVLIYLKLKNSIDWKSYDNSLTKHLFCILVPKNNQDNIHLETLSKISLLLLNENAIKSIDISKSQEDIFNIVNDFLVNKEKQSKKQITNSQNQELVIGVTSCAVGIAHTYLSAEKLEKELTNLGYSHKIETRGSAGVKNEITDAEIKKASFVIVASDVELDLSKFNGKRLYKTSTKEAIHNPGEVIKNAKEKSYVYQQENDNKNSQIKDGQKTGLIKHILTGISHMIPFVIFGGILIALSLGLGKAIYGNSSSAPKGDFLWWMEKIGAKSFDIMIGVLGAYIAFSIAGRAALMPGFVVSLIANDNKLFYNIGGINVVTPMGFIGAILFGILIGFTVKWLNSLTLPKSISSLMPMFIIPIGVTLFYALITIFLIGAPIGLLMNKFISSLKYVFQNNNNVGLYIVLGALIGAMAGFDMGGPINKVAFLTSSGLLVSGVSQPMGMMGAAIPVAPLGMGLATLLFRRKFNDEEKSMGISALIMGMIGISEGAIPFAIASPKKVITANVVGSAVAGAIAGALSVTNAAAHGGPIVAILGAVSSSYGFALGILFFFIAVIAGTITTALIYGFWKKVDESQKSPISKINFKNIWRKITFQKGVKDAKK